MSVFRFAARRTQDCWPRAAPGRTAGMIREAFRAPPHPSVVQRHLTPSPISTKLLVPGNSPLWKGASIGAEPLLLVVPAFSQVATEQPRMCEYAALDLA